MAYIAAGSGSHHCGACFHTLELVSGLRQAGVDAILVPVYLPLVMDEEARHRSLPQTRIFFGGISVFLEQYVPVFRRTPTWLDRLWANRWLLGFLGRFAGATRPEKLGPLTVSMLLGELGYQHKEVDRLLEFLQGELRPDVVHLSTALLVGLAPALERHLGAPVVANLAGEDGFLERLPEPYRSRARQLAAEKLANLPAVVALSGFHGQRAAEYFGLSPDRVWIIPPGVRVESQGAREVTRPEAGSPACCFGYLGRICEEKGLGILLEAAARLAEEPGGRHVRWLLAGRQEPRFRRTFGRLIRHAERLGAKIDYLGPLDAASKEAFFDQIHALVLPSVVPEPKAVTAVEAAARAIPVIAPGHGAFVEIIRQAGRGELYWPNDAIRLCEVLRRWTEYFRSAPAAGSGSALANLAWLQGGRSQSEAADHLRQNADLRADDASTKVTPAGAGADLPPNLAVVRKWQKVGALPNGPVDWGLEETSFDSRFSTAGMSQGPEFFRAERMVRQTLALYRRLLCEASAEGGASG